MKKNILYILVGIVFFILWLFFVDWEKSINYFRNINVFWIFNAITAGLIQNLISAYKLQILLKNIKKVSLFFILRLMYISSLTSIVTSLPAGGFTMTYFIKQNFKSNYTKIFSILLVDYLYNILAILTFAFIGGIYFVFWVKEFKLLPNAVSVLLVITLLVSVLIIIFILFMRIRLLNHPYLAKFKFLFGQFAEGIKITYSDKSIPVKALSISILSTFMNSFIMFCYFNALGATVNYLHLFLAMNIFALLNVLPGLPAKLGQYELLSMVTLPYLLNIDRNLIFVIAFLEHTVGISVAMLLGAISLYSFRKQNIWRGLVKVKA